MRGLHRYAAVLRSRLGWPGAAAAVPAAHATPSGLMLRCARALPALTALAVLLGLGASGAALAEGSRTLHPATGPGSTGNRGVMDLSNGLYAGVARQRQFLYVYAQAGEVILLGSRNRSNGGDVLVYNPQSFGARGNETIPAASNFS